MGSIGKFISSSFDSGRRRIKAIVKGKSDIRRFFEAMPFGEDSLPPEGTRTIVIDTEEKGRMMVIGYINENQLDDLTNGEKRIYSLKQNGDISQFIYLKSDGTMEIGGNSDFMVRYTALETAFNQLKSDYNSHMHPTAATGSPSPPTVVNTSDITLAKIDEIKTL